jgi:hypothetical protein
MQTSFGGRGEVFFEFWKKKFWEIPPNTQKNIPSTSCSESNTTNFIFFSKKEGNFILNTCFSFYVFQHHFM